MDYKMKSLKATIDVEVMDSSVLVPTDIKQALDFFKELRDNSEGKAKKGYSTCVSLLNWAIQNEAVLSNTIHYPDAYSFEFAFKKYSNFRIFGDSLEFNVKGTVMSTC